MSATPSRRDAEALTEACTAGCWSWQPPYAVRHDGRAGVVASYACRCGAAWSTWWSTVFLPARSRLRST